MPPRVPFSLFAGVGTDRPGRQVGAVHAERAYMLRLTKGPVVARKFK
jgi:hypothetical protein